MLLPTRGKLLAEVISRERMLPSGLVLPDKQRLEKKDNICRCLGVGEPGISPKGKPIPMIARRTDIIHFDHVSVRNRFTYENRKYLVFTNNEIIAIERDGEIIAPRSNVICKLTYAEKVGKIIIPENVKVNSGDFWGEVVAVGPDYPDTNLVKGDNIYYLRSEGYRFRTLGREDLLSVQEKWIYGRSK